MINSQIFKYTVIFQLSRDPNNYTVYIGKHNFEDRIERSAISKIVIHHEWLNKKDDFMHPYPPYEYSIGLLKLAKRFDVSIYIKNCIR